MNDEEHLRSFEDQSLPQEQWNHRAHLKVAYLYLLRYPYAEALERGPAGATAAVTAAQDEADRRYAEALDRDSDASAAATAAAAAREEEDRRYAEALQRGRADATAADDDATAAAREEEDRRYAEAVQQDPAGAIAATAAQDEEDRRYAEAVELEGRLLDEAAQREELHLAALAALAPTSDVVGDDEFNAWMRSGSSLPGSMQGLTLESFGLSRAQASAGGAGPSQVRLLLPAPLL